jgi:hypothetical protein
LSLRVVEWHTETLEPLYSEAVQTWIPWCGASCSPRVDPSTRRRVVGESLESPHRMSPCPAGGDAAGDLPHIMHILHEHPHELILRGHQLLEADWQMRWWGRGACPRGGPHGGYPRPFDDSGMLSNDYSVDRVCTICHK